MKCFECSHPTGHYGFCPDKHMDELLALEAQCAAMREALEVVIAAWRCSDVCRADEDTEHCVCWKSELREALASDAGEALLARLENLEKSTALYSASMTAQRERAERLMELADVAWGVIANAGWRDESKSPRWDEAAARWRDQWHAELHKASK